jgi:hypothetical protein
MGTWVKAKCFVCGRRPARYLKLASKTFRDLMAPPLEAFCSKRCAADYAIWWGIERLLVDFHWCPRMACWEPVPQKECLACGPESAWRESS